MGRDRNARSHGLSAGAPRFEGRPTAQNRASRSASVRPMRHKFGVKSVNAYLLRTAICQ
jgi:hypothetical protein